MMTGSFADTITKMADLVLPRQCTVCGRKLMGFERHLCTGCMADMPFTFNWMMRHNPMADKFNEKVQESLCGREISGKLAHKHIPYCFAASLFFFNSEALYRRIPYCIKYSGDIPLGIFFGRMLGERLHDSPFLGDVDLIVPVPLHWTRKWRRGYNQAEILANGISETLHARICTDFLSRQRRTKTQTRLSVEEKTENVKTAFRIRRDTPQDTRHILLVDDVFTTGATLQACWRAIVSSGNRARISIATLAVVSN